jgi:hypothetical protein
LRSDELTGPGGEAISPAMFRAWSSAVLGESVDLLRAELRRALTEWHDAARAASARTAIAPAASAPGATSVAGVFAQIGAKLDGLVSGWRWSERPVRWIRAARERVRRSEPSA